MAIEADCFIVQIKTRKSKMPKGKGKKAIQKNKKPTKNRPKVNIPDSVDKTRLREMSKFELVFHRLKHADA